MVDEPLHDFAKLFDVEGLNMAELGIMMKESICRSKMRIGCAARFMQHTPVGSVAADIDCDVLPLPVPTPSPEEVRL